MQLTLGEHVIDCTHHTAVMGILNVATDSPVSHSVVARDAAVARSLELRRQGAEIIDVGAHSTRTNGRDVPPAEEMERVCPVIEALAREGIPVSVDTWTASVARAAAEAGVHLLNDVTGFADPAMVAVAAEYRLPGVVMHMRGAPKHHREVEQHLADPAGEVREFLLERAALLEAAGAPAPWLDPGFDFGKPVRENLRLLTDLPALVATGYPVLISASRKGFLGPLMGYERRQDVPGLLEGTLAFNTLAASLGAHVVRVHDVFEVSHALRVVDAVRAEAATAASG